MINFRSPSENSPFVPAALSILSWIILNAFLLFGLGRGGLSAILGEGLLSAALLFVIAVLSLIILIAYLFRKKFKNFFIAIALLVVASILTNMVDRLIAPYKLQRVMGTMASSMASLAKDAQRSRRFGNTFPVNVCEPNESATGSRSCRACFCPNGMDLAEFDGIPKCSFRLGNGEETGERFDAPCSGPRTVPQAERDVKDLFASDAVKTFLLYTYRDNRPVTCHEYRVWDSWNTSIMKKVCEDRSSDKCLVQDNSHCSSVGATTICEHRDLNTDKAIKMVAYTNSYSVRGFKPEECHGGR